MIVQNITEAVIYESPDGGKTVYVRKSGQDVRERQLHWESDEARELREQIKQQELWNKIHVAAKTNPMLQRALDEAVMIYNLSK